MFQTGPPLLECRQDGFANIVSDIADGNGSRVVNGYRHWRSSLPRVLWTPRAPVAGFHTGPLKVSKPWARSAGRSTPLLNYKWCCQDAPTRACAMSDTGAGAFYVFDSARSEFKAGIDLEPRPPWRQRIPIGVRRDDPVLLQVRFVSFFFSARTTEVRAIYDFAPDDVIAEWSS
jgi:hypothetical protein